MLCPVCRKDRLRFETPPPPGAIACCPWCGCALLIQEKGPAKVLTNKELRALCDDIRQDVQKAQSTSALPPKAEHLA